MNWVDKILGHKKQTKEEIINEFEEQVAYIEKKYESNLMKTIKPQDIEENLRCIVEFTVDNNNEISLNIKWNTDDDITAISIGQLLFAINEGEYKETAKDILIGVAKDYPHKEDFIIKCFESWRFNKDQDPLIKPSQVFGMGKQPGGVFQHGYKSQ